MYNYDEKSRKNIGITKWILWGVLGFIGLLTVVSSIYLINPGFRGVLTTLGKVAPRSYSNGIGFKWPFISSMKQMDVRTQAFTEQTSSYTSDVQTAQMKYTFTYELNPTNVHILYESIGVNYEVKKIVPILNDVLKDVIGKWQAQDLVANRDKARVDILEGLNARIDPVFFQNLTFQIIDVDYSDNFEKAIENKVIAEQRAQEAVNDTKRIKEEAEQKLVSAKAEAEAMEIKSQALARNKGLTEYEAVQKWDGKLPQYMLGNSVPLLNLETK